MILHPGIYGQVIGNNVIDALLLGFGHRPGRISNNKLNLNGYSDKWNMWNDRIKYCISHDQGLSIMEKHPGMLEQTLKHSYVNEFGGMV